MLRWSKHLRVPPMRLAPEEVGSLRDRAYPYADTAGVRVNIEHDGSEPPPIIVTPTSVTFIGQRGPIGEVGVNGCQIDDILTFCLGTLQTFSKKFPCRQNSLAITNLQQSLMWLEDRTRDREARGVEGQDKE
jgi:hypothetical protein